MTSATERLASGKLDPITGLDNETGELNKMVSALKVFRAGLVEKSQLEEEESYRNAQQSEVVNQLASALKKLSSGDLHERIDQEFAPEYEVLRADFR